ncbi:MAG: S41 family peptidase, partial [Candidatus Eremiobacteraeota bacterium]|nr:S41 family peptidase [Candidatus Eremiobacteraeota bacterium]
MRLTRRTGRMAVVATVALAPLVAGGWLAQSRGTREGPALLEQVMGLVSQRFVDTVGAGMLYEKAARGLVKELNDPYSELFTPKQIADFTRNTNGRYAGIGMEITLPQGGYVTVSRVFPHSPAEGAGVQEGDRIAQVDTTSAKGFTSTQVQNLLIGQPGTPVTVRFVRPGVAQPIIARLKRAIIHVPAVQFSLVLDGTVAYIPVQRFNETTAQDIAEALRGLERQGAKSLVLDLRSNGGGILDQAVATSNLFLRRGQEILTQRGRQGESQAYVATEAPLVPTMPMVVMTDGGTASASEIVAGALQDHDRALVVGTTSFGKGLVQTLFPLDGGYALKLTTAKWFTPTGRSIHKERKLTADGQFVEVHPDSLETDSAKKARPVFRSDAGRVVYGGGAITPDVTVKPDTLSTSEQTLAKSLAPKFAELYGILSDIAFEKKGKVRPDFTVDPAWREEVYQRLVQAKIPVNRAQWDAGKTWVDRQIEQRVARVAFGDSTAFRHAEQDDVQLERAVQILKRGGTQRELFAVAQAMAPASTANRTV